MTGTAKTNRAGQFAVGDEVQLIEALSIFGEVAAVDIPNDRVQVRFSGYLSAVREGATSWNAARQLKKVGDPR